MTDDKKGSGDFSIGGNVLPGLGKLVEEMNELGTVLGKLIATSGQLTYWEGKPLDERLVEELADVQAAMEFFIRHNLNQAQVYQIESRYWSKITLFSKWHTEQSKAST
jgi:hypothetical protein